MKKERKVAICIPAYNDIDKFSRAVDSVIGQDYNNYIVLVSDDSTNNDIRDYLSGLSDNRIIYDRNSDRLGATANTNKLLKQAYDHDPNYIKILHQDDYFSYSSSLSKMVEAMEADPSVTVLFSALFQEDEKGKRLRVIADKEDIVYLKNDWRYIYRHNFLFGPSNTLLRTESGEALLFDENLTFLMDIDLYVRLLRENCNFLYVSEPLVTNGTHQEQLSTRCGNTPHFIAKEILYIFEKYWELQEQICFDWTVYNVCKYELPWISSVQELKSHFCSDNTVGWKVIERISKLIIEASSNDLQSIVFVGIGTVFWKHYDSIRRLHRNKRIVAYLDNNPNATHEDITINRMDSITDYSYDSIIITTPKHYYEIRKQLCEQFKVPKEKIMPKETIFMLHMI